MKDLTKGNILKGLIAFTLPLLLGNFFQVLYNTADTLIVGQTLGKDALASVGATGSINFLIVGFAQGMTAGLTILTAQRFGAKDKNSVKKSYITGLYFTIAISILLSIVSVIFVGSLLELMQTPSEIFAGAKTFLTIMLGGMIATNLYAYLSNALRALGDSKTPLYALVVASILNIGLEYFAILVLHLGLLGSSAATILAQAISVIYLFWHIKKKVPDFHLTKDLLGYDPKEVLHHARLAVPMGFQSSIIAIGSITLQIALNKMGTNAVATQAIVSKIDQLAMLPMMSIGLAMATFGAQNYGAKQYKRINQGLSRSIAIAVGWSIGFALLLNLAHFYFTTAFISASQTAVIKMASHYYLVNGSFYWLLAILFVTRSTIQGLGNAKIPTLCGFAELFMRAGVAIVGVLLLNYTVIISSNPAAWIGSTSILIPTTIQMVKRFRNNQDLYEKAKLIPKRKTLRNVFHH
ncbi:MATE family efflux transporter [Lactococcus allomyrinae]|uniref:MATE family efflux transporter n=1 Tax=Lactococcus allomyrinae TaxID=2419773 RepID=A0A387BJN9_9LACT|nr:MATE family efflux transporter [Lactococcus allomyrinae]AYG01519.1 MATE family efflux transporter [Lactococcus allomyrinae]